MDRTIIIDVVAPIPHGSRVEVVERVEEDDTRVVLVVTDLDTRIRYQQGDPELTGTTTWIGRVLECTIRYPDPSDGDGRRRAFDGIRTSLLIDPVTPGAVAVDIALRGADAAASAITTEALRWGGGDRVPEPEPPRFW